MTSPKKQKRQQSCDVAKLIDAIERALSTAVTIYRAVEPMVKAILNNVRKPK
jgi:hypothetical protein